MSPDLLGSDLVGSFNRSAPAPVLASNTFQASSERELSGRATAMRRPSPEKAKSQALVQGIGLKSGSRPPRAASTTKTSNLSKGLARYPPLAAESAYPPLAAESTVAAITPNLLPSGLKAIFGAGSHGTRPHETAFPVVQSQTFNSPSARAWLWRTQAARRAPSGETTIPTMGFVPTCMLFSVVRS